ncbi:MAG: bifunctional metallophosphatase/5'-nucleotidase [Saprospiraceae bacterium]|nr:bifunctional metallophosphatase/5'-nucleotidase [Saprospiraceae bacterium]
MQRNTGFYILLFVLLFSACQTPQQGFLTRMPIEVTFLQLNDVYEIAPLEGGKAGGLARVATVVKELERENPNTIAILSGDFLSPSFIGSLKMENGDRIAGLQMVETLNAAGLDYVTFGNHEFDNKDPLLLKKRMDASQFIYTCCNVQEVKNGQKGPFMQLRDGKEQPVPEYVIREFSNLKGDVFRIGIIGVLLPFAKQDFVHYLPVFETFQATLQKLRPQVDVVVALTHLNIEDDEKLAAAAPGVLLFMGGHDHNNMSRFVESTVITKADANAKTVYIHRITFNPGSKTSTLRSSLKTIDDRIEEDAATKAVVDKWQAYANKSMANMGYTPTRVLMHAETPLECTETAIRTRPTNYGKLAAEAFATAWPGADAYVLNSGSMRVDDNLSGDITEYDVLRTFPFAGSIVKVDLPGDVLKQVLDIGLMKNRGEGGYFQTAQIQDRGDQWQINGEILRSDRRYSVVMPKFLAEGNENNLGMLKNYPFQEVPAFAIKGGTLKNDVRDIVMYHMAQSGQ